MIQLIPIQLRIWIKGGANPRDDQADPAAPNAPAQERPCTRLSRGIRRPKVRIDGTIPYTCFANRVEPRSLEEALSNKNWKQAIDIEYDALVKNKAWHLFLLRRVEMWLTANGFTK
jgi:hypothetical protein